jgi:hypothetical protein
VYDEYGDGYLLGCGKSLAGEPFAVTDNHASFMECATACSIYGSGCTGAIYFITNPDTPGRCVFKNTQNYGFDGDNADWDSIIKLPLPSPPPP